MIAETYLIGYNGAEAKIDDNRYAPEIFVWDGPGGEGEIRVQKTSGSERRGFTMKESSVLDWSWNAVGLLNRDSESSIKQKWSGLTTKQTFTRGYRQHKG